MLVLAFLIPGGILSMTKAKKDTPVSNFTTTVNGEEVELFMSFARLNRICAVVGDAEQVARIFSDPTMQMNIMTVLLAPKDVKFEEFRLDDYEIDPSEIPDILHWVSEHLLDFFLTALEKGMEMGQKNSPRLQKLAEQMSSLGGLQASQ